MIDKSWAIKEWTGNSGIGGPERAANALRHHPGFVWLDSALAHPVRGRWSILAANPRWTLEARGSRLRHRSASGTVQSEGDPIAVAAQLIEAEQKKFPIHHSATNSPNLPFAGGTIGYFGFELARHIESLPATTIDDVGAADLVIGWYDAALVWDRLNQNGWLSGTTNAIADLSELLAGTKAESELAPIPGEVHRSHGGPTQFESNMARSEYLERIEAARRYIEAGDIYQVNLSQRFSAPLAISGFKAYM
ncbi:MAG: chorismate-binding protein, partial [Chloroflexota bacterium]|nr:chorismate-binding protein [Chloroflexota bacterium]